MLIEAFLLLFCMSSTLRQQLSMWRCDGKLTAGKLCIAHVLLRQRPRMHKPA